MPREESHLSSESELSVELVAAELPQEEPTDHVNRHYCLCTSQNRLDQINNQNVISKITEAISISKIGRTS